MRFQRPNCGGKLPAKPIAAMLPTLSSSKNSRNANQRGRSRSNRVVTVFSFETFLSVCNAWAHASYALRARWLDPRFLLALKIPTSLYKVVWCIRALGSTSTPLLESSKSSECKTCSWSGRQLRRAERERNVVLGGLVELVARMDDSHSAIRRIPTKNRHADVVS